MILIQAQIQAPSGPPCDLTSFSTTFYIPLDTSQSPTSVSSSACKPILWPCKPLKTFKFLQSHCYYTLHDCSHNNKVSLSQTKSLFSWKHLKSIKVCKKITHTAHIPQSTAGYGSLIWENSRFDLDVESRKLAILTYSISKKKRITRINWSLLTFRLSKSSRIVSYY